MIAATIVNPTHYCWICGRAVSLQNCKTDEHGHIVHSECYAARMRLKQAGSVEQGNAAESRRTA